MLGGFSFLSIVAEWVVVSSFSSSKLCFVSSFFGEDITI